MDRCELEIKTALNMLYGVFTIDYNENHDPDNGQFAEGPGSGGGTGESKQGKEKTIVNETGVKKREKSIRTLKKRIEQHKQSIADPKTKYPEWDIFKEDRKASELKHWKHEIKTFEKEIEEYEQEIARFREDDT